MTKDQPAFPKASLFVKSYTIVCVCIHIHTCCYIYIYTHTHTIVYVYTLFYICVYVYILARRIIFSLGMDLLKCLELHTWNYDGWEGKDEI